MITNRLLFIYMGVVSLECQVELIKHIQESCFYIIFKYVFYFYLIFKYELFNYNFVIDGQMI